MSLCALTLCRWVKIVRVIRIDSWEVFLNISVSVWSTATELCVPIDIMEGQALVIQEFMTIRIDAAWKRGKIYGFLLSFHTVDFVVA